MFRKGAKTAVLLAALGGLLIGVGPLSGRSGAIVGLMFTNLFRTHPTTQERVARLRASSV